MKTRYPTSEYLEHKFQHLHAAITLDAAKNYMRFVKQANGKMIVTLAHETSLPSIGLALAQMIRGGLVHAIITTGAAIEDDLERLCSRCKAHDKIRKLWRQAGKDGQRFFHWEIINQLVLSGGDNDAGKPLPRDSWLKAACEQKIPVYVPGIENSTLGRLFCADVVRGGLHSHMTMKSGTEQYAHLCDWYQTQQKQHDIGIFQVGENVTTDFCRSVVASIGHEQGANCKLLRYCAVVSDQTLVNGNRGRANHNNINLCNPVLGKKRLRHHCSKHIGHHDVQDPEHQSFNIRADASTIVPLIFNYILELWTRQQANDLLARTLSKVSYG